MTAFNFNNPSRQSVKGIVVIFGVSVYKVSKGILIASAALLLKYLQSGKGPDFTQPKFVLSIAAIVVFFLFIAILRFLNFKFYIREEYFFLKKGIINKEEISVSFSRIQNVYIKQNLLQQLIDVVSLSIETAGDDKTEIEITALSRPKALALKKLLLVGAKEQGLTESSEDSNVEEEVYFKASIKKLLLEGISENHLKSFILIFAFLVGIYQDLKEFVDNVEFAERFREWFQLESESMMALLLFNLTLLGILLVVSFFFSMIRMFVQNFNLTVLRKANGLEISKGLFNKINLGLTSSRIQTTTVSTNKLKKALGLYKLSFTQAMANKKQQLKFSIVGLNHSQIYELLEQFYPKGLNRLVRHKPNIYIVYKRLWINSIILLVVNIGLYFLPAEFLLLNLIFLLYIALNTYYMYKKTYYHVDENYIVLGGGGLIETISKYLEVHKTQAVEIKQTIFQKRRRLASLTVHSASKSITIPHIDKTEAVEISNFILYLVESQNKNWM
ncbi:PH domain-containing protein [Winogradskyella sp. DF17]|uniref:PH domain-containing protein n=1 Tax=Winogradskyella pelagia TaxID=2819984 RepID=A0ABS3T5I0_9FLAO|nr:PH domain-containing protein [Winogradskyella sp. DF17]MBO3117519.1 PH domain-containing protein [Winogradskyella sp. DF17]